MMKEAETATKHRGLGGSLPIPGAHQCPPGQQADPFGATASQIAVSLETATQPGVRLRHCGALHKAHGRAAGVSEWIMQSDPFREAQRRYPFKNALVLLLALLLLRGKLLKIHLFVSLYLLP